MSRVFNITPLAKPRMVKSDAWKQRPTVLRYWAFKDQLTLLANKAGYVVPDSAIHLIFIIPMPKSWSKKKREKMNYEPHQQKPDVDNLIKAFLDCLCKDDSYVWDIRGTKYWGEKGKIKY